MQTKGMSSHKSRRQIAYMARSSCSKVLARILQRHVDRIPHRRRRATVVHGFTADRGGGRVGARLRGLGTGRKDSRGEQERSVFPATALYVDVTLAGGYCSAPSALLGRTP